MDHENAGEGRPRNTRGFGSLARFGTVCRLAVCCRVRTSALFGVRTAHVAWGLAEFMCIVERQQLPLACDSDPCLVDSGGPQISCSLEDRYFSWSFEELLDDADGHVGVVVERIATQIG